MSDKFTNLNKVYLHDKGLSEKGIEDAHSRLSELINVMMKSLEERKTDSDNIIYLRHSGGVELHKTSEALVLGVEE